MIFFHRSTVSSISTRPLSKFIFSLSSQTRKLLAFQLISQTGDGTTLDCAEGKENCDQDATALIEEACSYYEQWGKLSNEHVIQYIKMFPERSFTDLETTCKNSQVFVIH